MKRFLCFLLAALMCVTTLALASCDTGNGNSEETTEKPNDDPIIEEEGEATLDVPESLDYKNATFTVFGYNSNIKEYWDDTLGDSDTVNSALFDRDTYVEDYLGITFIYEQANGQFADRITYAQNVTNNILAGNGAYDIIGAYSLVPPALSMNNVLLDMSTLDHLDFEKPWWPAFMTEECTVNGKIYFNSGDISSNLLYNMQGVLFDVDQMVAAGITEESVFGLVDSGEWTLEKFFEMTNGLNRDNGDSTWTEADFYALCLNENVQLDSFYFATGLRLFEENEDGTLQISSDITSDRTLDIYSMVFDKMYGESPAYISRDLLKEGRAIFCIGTVYTLRNALDVDADYGILPFPKYDTRDDYKTLVSSPHTQYCIPIDVKDKTRSAAVLETMAYASNKLVTPVIFESVMKLRYSKDESYSRMFDIMRSGTTTDLGILYYTSFAKDPQSMFRNSIIKKVTGWVSNYRNNYAVDMEKVVGQINELFQK